MKSHFILLVCGSLIFLFFLVRETHESVVWSSDPGGAAAKNTAHLLIAVQWIGAYCVFSALVIGHGVLRRPPQLSSDEQRVDS